VALEPTTDEPAAVLVWSACVAELVPATPCTPVAAEV
jgi:hypothetical protein